jgi:hypothetical protein
MVRRSKPKRKRTQNRAPNLFRSQLNEQYKALLDRIGKGASILPSLPNANDNLVIGRLYRTPIGESSLDLYAPDAFKSLAEFRLALIKVYIEAAEERRSSKATKGQLKSASTALSQLTRAVEKLDQVSPVGQRGLQLAVTGSPLDDITGELELNEFATVCRNTKMSIASYASALSEAIKTEKTRQTRSGERQKRLRTLVEALADWWQSIGGSLAPTVDANRFDDGRAVVHGRRGDFLQLAVQLFSHVDVFAHTEVEAAVTNVYEARQSAARSRSAA